MATEGARRLISRIPRRRWTAICGGAALLSAAAGAAASLGQPAGDHPPRARAGAARRAAAGRGGPGHRGAANAAIAAQAAANAAIAAQAAANAAIAAQAAAAAQQAAARLLAARCGARVPAEHLITHRRWLSGVIVTEYYPAPERWFSGLGVPTPGMTGRHPADWLYSARGLSMEGDGLDRSGRLAHIQTLGDVGWVNAAGVSTVPPRCGIRWSHGPPAWRAGGWRNRGGQVTYPLQAGGWSNGRGHWVGDYGGATFASGPSLPVRFYHSVAVDRGLISEGSRIYLPDYRNVNGGWFVAQDTGGAIIGRHIDVYRPPPAQPFGSGRLILGARAYVIPPGG